MVMAGTPMGVAMYSHYNPSQPKDYWLGMCSRYNLLKAARSHRRRQLHVQSALAPAGGGQQSLLPERRGDDLKSHWQS